MTALNTPASDVSLSGIPPSSQAESSLGLGLRSGVGLVIANMVGVGVLTTTGYMTQSLGPKEILLAWIVGAIVALCGARAYGALAALVPRSGGEYRYLSELAHPALGYIAGWASLLVGFTAPVAAAAYAAGAFAETLVPGVSARGVGLALIVVVTAAHALHFGWSRIAQNVLSTLSVVVLVSFVLIGAVVGSHELPTWQPVQAASQGSGFPFAAFFVSLVYVAYSYSGWNAAVYAAEEFSAPRRDVPRAMLIGASLTAALYLLVNLVFMANLTGHDMASWVEGDTQRITLAHLVLRALVGADGARVMSIAVVAVLTASVSVMTLAGPRVYSSMALDGLFPRVLAAKRGRPPYAAMLVQSGLAAALLLTNEFGKLVELIGAVLTLTSALTVLTLFRTRASGTPVALSALLAASVFTAAAIGTLFFTFSKTPVSLIGCAAVVVCGVGAYALTKYVHRRRGRSTAF